MVSQLKADTAWGLLATPASRRSRSAREKRCIPAVHAFLLCIGLGLAMAASPPLPPSSLPSSSRSPWRLSAAGAGDNDGAALVEQRCLGCHIVEKLQRYNKTEEQWERTIVNMVGGYGVKVTDAEKAILAGYMANNFGAKRLQKSASE